MIAAASFGHKVKPIPDREPDLRRSSAKCESIPTRSGYSDSERSGTYPALLEPSNGLEAHGRDPCLQRFPRYMAVKRVDLC